jgi:hypothetical protein
VHYYDLDAANSRLRDVRPILEGLRSDRDEVANEQRALERLGPESDDPGVIAERDQRGAAIRDAVGRMRARVVQLVGWDVNLRDISTGLIDFPALANGRPVWLCWRLGEDEIAWWHAVDEGFAGRKPLTDLPGPTEEGGPVS